MEECAANSWQDLPRRVKANGRSGWEGVPLGGGNLLLGFGSLALTSVGSGLSIEFLRRSAVPPLVDFLAGTLAHAADNAALREAVFGNGVVKSGLAAEEFLRA